jgi:hypothetical protein
MKARKIIKSILEENAIDAKKTICEDLALKLGQRLAEEYKEIAKTYFSEENGGGGDGGGGDGGGGESGGGEGEYSDQDGDGDMDKVDALIALFMKRGMPRKRAIALATEAMKGKNVSNNNSTNFDPRLAYGD